MYFRTKFRENPSVGLSGCEGTNTLTFIGLFP